MHRERSRSRAAVSRRLRPRLLLHLDVYRRSLPAPRRQTRPLTGPRRHGRLDHARARHAGDGLRGGRARRPVRHRRRHRHRAGARGGAWASGRRPGHPHARCRGHVPRDDHPDIDLLGAGAPSPRRGRRRDREALGCVRARRRAARCVDRRPGSQPRAGRGVRDARFAGRDQDGVLPRPAAISRRACRAPPG